MLILGGTGPPASNGNRVWSVAGGARIEIRPTLDYHFCIVKCRIRSRLAVTVKSDAKSVFAH